jgi:hypothetical protein
MFPENNKGTLNHGGTGSNSSLCWARYAYPKYNDFVRNISSMRSVIKPKYD